MCCPLPPHTWMHVLPPPPTWMLMRVRGLRSRQRLMTSTAAGLEQGGKLMRYESLHIAFILGMKARSEKGVRPNTIWYRMQPRDQTSESRPT